MNRDWEKSAEDCFKSETAEAKASSHFAFNVFLGILIAVVVAAIDAVGWFFFARVPAKGDLWGLLIMIVAFPVFDRFYTPIAEARAMQAKRAIRIEAKLDYLLGRHSEE